MPKHRLLTLMRKSASSSLLSGLAAYWKMNEANGDAIDSAGTNTLTAGTPNPTSAGGVLGTSRAFSSGLGHTLSIADNAVLSSGDRDFHFAGWVYPTGFSSSLGKYIFSKVDDATHREFWLTIITANNRAQFFVSPNGTSFVSVEAQVNMVINTWYFIDCGHDSVNNQIFCRVNNGTKYTTSHSAGVFDSTSLFRVSGVFASPSNYFDGRIDELSRWNRLLSDAEIATLYNGGAGLTFPFS